MILKHTINSCYESKNPLCQSIPHCNPNLNFSPAHNAGTNPNPNGAESQKSLLNVCAVFIGACLGKVVPANKRQGLKPRCNMIIQTKCSLLLYLDAFCYVTVKLLSHLFSVGGPAKLNTVAYLKHVTATCLKPKQFSFLKKGSFSQPQIKPEPKCNIHCCLDQDCAQSTPTEQALYCLPNWLVGIPFSLTDQAKISDNSGKDSVYAVFRQQFQQFSLGLCKMLLVLFQFF